MGNNGGTNTGLGQPHSQFGLLNVTYTNLMIKVRQILILFEDDTWTFHIIAIEIATIATSVKIFTAPIASYRAPYASQPSRSWLRIEYSYLVNTSPRCEVPGIGQFTLQSQGDN